MIESGTVSSTMVLCALCHHPMQEALPSRPSTPKIYNTPLQNYKRLSIRPTVRPQTHKSVIALQSSR